jgi:hypothetical protein
MMQCVVGSVSASYITLVACLMEGFVKEKPLAVGSNLIHLIPAGREY